MPTFWISALAYRCGKFAGLYFASLKRTVSLVYLRRALHRTAVNRAREVAWGAI